MNQVYIGLGSNMGRRHLNFRKALSLLEGHNKLQLKRVSAVYETSPLGPPQRSYLNAVIEINTMMTPSILLRTLKGIEKRLGRQNSKSSEKWGPRVLDLDILFYGHRIMRTKKLVVPHQQIAFRRFVLKPMADLDPLFYHPQLKKSVKQLLLESPKTGKVRRWGKIDWNG